MIINTLTKKELKQNMVIYIIPYLVLLILWLIFREARFIPEKWINILAVALPVSLGGAYGLQAFDLEENGQTRDFLLVKPITISQILWTKFYTGLLVLLPVTFLWLNWLIPKTLRLPDPTSPSSIWGLTVLLLVLIIYVVAFTVGIFIKGPLKIVGALVILPVAGSWFFFAWGQLLTPIFWNDWLFNNRWLNLFWFVIATLFPIIMILLFSNRISNWHISQQAFTSFGKRLYTILAVCISVPLLFWGINDLTKPVVFPFNQLSAVLVGIEDWYIAVEGAKQPAGDQYAFSDVQGRLGIAKSGRKIRVIYSGKPVSQSIPVMLTNLAWSPDGTQIAFCENHQIKIYSLKSRSIKTVGTGDIPLWSNDSRQMLIAKLLGKKMVNTAYGPVEQKKYQLSLDDLGMSRISSYGNLSSLGSSLAWDSIRNRLLTVDISGNLVIIDLTHNRVASSLLIPGKYETIFFSKIQPLVANRFELLVYSFDPTDFVSKTAKKYTLRRYLLDCKTDSIHSNGLLKRLSYKDVVSTDKRQQIMIRSSDNGVYRLIKLPEEVKQ